MIRSSKQRTQTNVAVETIQNMIFEGELAAGTDHLETELAERLGMSRTPVREATLVLESQGLLQVRPRKGVRILSMSVKDMDEIYEILTELEGLAAFSAARKRYSKRELSVLAKFVKDMDVSLSKGDRENWATADEGFHKELMRLSGNERMISVVSIFNDQVRRARSMTLNLRELPKKSNDDHRAVLRAIEKGDAETAKKLHRKHRTQARKMMLGLIAKLGIKHL